MDIMRSSNNYLYCISVAKHVIHDIIAELIHKFNFDKFLFLGKFTMVFIAAYIGIILFRGILQGYQAMPEL
jgi:hypothetical protein